jgi:hypothetical protein
MPSIRPKTLAKKLQFNNAPLQAQISILKRFELQAGPILPPEDQEWLKVTIPNLEREYAKRRKKPAL